MALATNSSLYTAPIHSSPTHERREYRRHESSWRVSILRKFVTSGEESRIVARLVNVSFRGVRVETLEALIPGEQVVLEVADEKSRITVGATVVWSSDLEEAGRGTGCELHVELTRPEAEFLRSVCG